MKRREMSDIWKDTEKGQSASLAIKQMPFIYLFIHSFILFIYLFIYSDTSDFATFRPEALKLGMIVNFDVPFLVIGFNRLIYELRAF